MPEKTVPLISVVVPVYNVRPWLRRCLDSVLAQTFTDWECILVDDGSTDGSGAVCDEYAARDPRFTVIHKENGGVSSARNAGLDAAKGEYIQFLDSDDWIDHRLMETAVELQRRDPEAMVIWFWNCHEELLLKKRGSSDPLPVLCTTREQQCWRPNLYVEVTMRLFPAEMVRQAGLRFDTALGRQGSVPEDMDFTRRYIDARYGAEDFPIFLITEPTYFYCRENPTSLSRAVHLPEDRINNMESPQSKYLDQMLQECARLRTTFDPGTDPMAVSHYTRHYLRCFAFGLWSARQLKEPLPENFFRRPEVLGLLALTKENRVFSAYYPLFRLGLAGPVARLYAWDEGGSIWYWRFYEVFYRLFFRGWER